VILGFCHFDREVFYFDEESRCQSDTQRFFSHAKLFQNDSGLLSFRQRSFLLRRGISLSFRQRSCFCFDEEYRCHSDTQRFFSGEKLLQNDSGLLSFRQRSFLFRRGISLSFRQRSCFCFDEESHYHSDRERFFSRQKLLQNDTWILSFRQRSFLFRRGIYLSFRQRSCFCFDEESLCHSDTQRSFSREKLLQNDSGLLSFRQRSCFYFDEESLCFR
jgi:hypothetical protein